MHIVENDWKSFFEEEMNKEYFLELKEKLKEREKESIIFPPKEDIFNIYKILNPSDIKVVIIGQDPYHGENQAHGLSFSVKEGVKVPPSLRNMYKELEESVVGFKAPTSGDLTKWANQGVFLLNNVLTVEKASPDSHKGYGWEEFTNKTIEYINENCENVVFVLWGGNARKKAKKLNKEKHLILESAHPSPLSAYRGFFGSDPFNKINNYLKANNKKEIDWNL